MNNEPVAWMREDGVIAFHTKKEVDSQGYKWQPLYTQQRPHNTVLVPCDKLAEMQAEIETLKAHPVKDLEDIDINITWNENSMRDFGKDELNFARAILRKAREK